jgi:hypothetical protein
MGIDRLRGQLRRIEQRVGLSKPDHGWGVTAEQQAQQWEDIAAKTAREAVLLCEQYREGLTPEQVDTSKMAGWEIDAHRLAAGEVLGDDRVPQAWVQRTCGPAWVEGEDWIPEENKLAIAAFLDVVDDRTEELFRYAIDGEPLVEGEETPMR